jgi:hypothetical protein
MIGEPDLRCPVCGALARSASERAEPVGDPVSGRAFWWSKVITTFEHRDGSRHRVTGVALFETTGGGR